MQSRSFHSLALVTAGLALFAAWYTGCVNMDGLPGNLAQGTVVPGGGAVTGQVSLSVLNSTGSVLYSQANASTALQLTAGVQYSLQLTGSNVPAGTTFTLQATDIDVVNGASTSTQLALGENPYTPPTPGDFVLTLTANGAASASVAPATYQTNVTCANPGFTASSLSAAGISVTAGSSNNLFGFSAAGVVTGANGMAPYLCAWDVNGDGIQDTPFSPCATGITGEYVNYVGTRSIGVLVKDACNITQAVSSSQNLAYTVPTMPGNVFIYGQVSAPTGTAAPDSRIAGVNYLATNAGGFNPVQPSYSPGASGKGSFTVLSAFNYGRASSVNFGLQLNLTGFSDTLNVSGMTGTVDATNATLGSTTYSVDEAGDQTPARTLTGSSCQLSNQGAQVKFLQGTPCASGTTGDTNSANIEVWGDYVCTVNDSGGAATITGSFDGVAHLADNCVGGGGGGGGGIVPIQL